MQTNNNEKLYYLHISDNYNYRANQFNPLFSWYNYNNLYGNNIVNNYLDNNIVNNYLDNNIVNNYLGNNIVNNYLDNNNVFMNQNINFLDKNNYRSKDPFEYLCPKIENIQSLEKEYLLSYYKYQKIKKN
jgi:hypothetical protein